MLQFLQRKFIEWALREFQRGVRDIPFSPLTREQQDGMLSQLWETKAFQNYLVKRETELVLAMSNRMLRPTNEEYLILYGRRVELMNLHDEARGAFNRTLTRRKSLATVQKTSV